MIYKNHRQTILVAERRKLHAQKNVMFIHTFSREFQHDIISVRWFLYKKTTKGNANKSRSGSLKIRKGIKVDSP